MGYTDLGNQRQEDGNTRNDDDLGETSLCVLRAEERRLVEGHRPGRFEACRS